MHYIDAELGGHCINLTWNCRVCVRVVFLFLLCACLPRLNTLEWIDEQHFENKDGVHFFAFSSECHNRYHKLILCNSEIGDIAWCNVNNTEWGFCAFFNNKNLFLFKKPKRRIKKTKNADGLVVFLKKLFFSTLVYFGLFMIFLWSHNLEQVTSLSVWLGYSIGPWYWRIWELLALEYVKNSVGNKRSFEESNPCSMCL